VAQLAVGGFGYDHQNKNENISPRWDLNPRPKVSAPPLKGERGITKPSPRKESDTASVNLQSPQELKLFCDWLKSQGKTRWTVKQTKNYATKYSQILQTGNASELMTLSPRNRHHALAALAILVKYQGQFDRWMQIRQRYNMKWSSGQESLQSFNRFFNPDMSLESMLQQVAKMISKTPRTMGQIIIFACLTGLRPAEAVESVRLINDKEEFVKYYNAQRQALEHFRFPSLFLRQTKKAYISFVTPEMLDTVRYAESSIAIPTYNAIRLTCCRKGVHMDMRYCRKIFASWLHNNGVSDVLIDLLQGRVGKSILVNHYVQPGQDYRDKILDAVKGLKQEIEM
jgi:Archaeal phage integrase